MMRTATQAPTCRVCSREYFQRSTMHAVCSPRCLLKEVTAKERVQREDRKTTAAKLLELKPRQYWLKQAEAAVNRYVRLRDAHLGCVSCDRPATWNGQWHASHLRSVGAASAVRFNLWNISKSCSVCNHHLSGNVAAYLPRAREKFGDEKIDWLYQQNHLVQYTPVYLKRLAKVMSKKAKRLEKRCAAQ